ncbi:MAG: low-specificity L-threonine aldolase [Deltaproteobacteria bacterium]|nr:low-specificity L-threonine aldolase [Deltaproteobacteria bacterium]
MKLIDLRSDTVTQPTPAMREAMAQAELGDDVFGEDPTVNRLEALAAERLGKEAALFVASGTMGNLVALLTHCGRGDEIIIGRDQHIFTSEAGGVAALGGIHPHVIPNEPDGTLRLKDIRAAIRVEDVHHPRTRLIVLENTHLRASGAPLAPDYLQAVRKVANEHGLKLHMDGARIFNAAIALGVPVVDLARDSDTVQFCLSKGLSAPVGSLLAGSEQFIAEGRRQRKMLGGGMRQAGVLAAAGIVALETMVERLAEDHANARYLAENLANLPRIDLDPQRIRTNMVFFGLKGNGLTAQELASRVKRERVLIQPRGPYHLRAAMHYGIERSDVDHALNAIKKCLA